MDTNDLLKEIFKRISKHKMMILAGGIVFAILFLFFANTKRTTYTAKATLFPLTHPNENSLASNTLSGILGLGEMPKSFSSEATINIIELALSRNIRQRVSSTRLKEFGNKTITELLVDDMNEHNSFLSEKIKIPADSEQLAILGSEILKPNINAKMSKNGVLEFYYTGNKLPLITPISNVLVNELSQFYIDLKRAKAIDDYNFTLGKIDSFQNMINEIDRHAIHIQKTTLFTPTDLLEYNLPKDNINADKIRIGRQRDMSINNRDEAVWRLQKVTPIIAVLDKPVGPFEEIKPPRIIYTLIGFILGIILTTLFLLSGLLYRYTRAEIYTSIFGKQPV